MLRIKGIKKGRERLGVGVIEGRRLYILWDHKQTNRFSISVDLTHLPQHQNNERKGRYSWEPTEDFWIIAEESSTHDMYTIFTRCNGQFKNIIV